MSRGRTLALACLTSAALVACCWEPADAASLFDPALHFRVLRTDHFRIYFHQGEDRLAARLAAIAEDGWRKLERPLGVLPPKLTHVVLADQTDLANGYATPLPYDTIVIYTTWPQGSEFATDDWLKLVFTHEFTHIVHLDRSESWARGVRAVLGRNIIAFPNLFLPTWQIEGLATFEESAITGEGRLHAGDFRAIVDEAARHRTLEPLDRVNGGLTDWPTGQAPYAYGLGFHEFLVNQYGAESLAKLAEATARRVPYTSPPVFRRLFGQSLGDLWRSYEASLESTNGSSTMDPRITRLTHHGFVSAGPRFDRVSGGLVYVKRTPDGFPTLQRIGSDGGGDTELTTRYFGSTTAIGTNTLYFDQIEFRRNVALESDLYQWSRDSGRVTPITRGQRLRDPDLSPDGTTLVAVQEQRGSRGLVLVSIDRRTVTTLVADPDTQFNAPRWSPDGGCIAVERHRTGADPEIVVVDVASRDVRVVAAAPSIRMVMAAWRPDGRAIVAAVAPDDHVFNLFEFSLGTPQVVRQLTHTTGGATWPDVSSDGRTLAFVGYTTSGYDVYSMPYPDDAEATALPNGITTPRLDVPAAATAQAARRYSPLPTLKPTSWTPILEWTSDQVRLGAATSGQDVLGYHSYVVAASWLLSSPANAPTPDRATPDWSAYYTYNRWRPRLFASASTDTSFFAGPATDQGTPSPVTRREREVEGGVVFPVFHARTSHLALASLFRSVDDYSGSNALHRRERTAPRLAWRSTTARTYGYSISPESGIVAGATAEFVESALGASADATTYTGDVRAYVPGFAPHHVLAARAAGGVSSGDRSVGRTFVLGGAAPNQSAIDFGSDAISLLRGFPGDSFAGSHVALVNADYRFPIARPQRGIGTWPFFLHTIHAAVFTDVGHAWTRTFDAGAVKTSIGGELSARTVIGYNFPLTVTLGAAWGHDGSGTLPNGVTVYVRAGRSF